MEGGGNKLKSGNRNVVEQGGWVKVQSSMKVATQMNGVVTKVCSVLAFIRQGNEYRIWNLMLHPYSTLGKPHLYSSVALIVKNIKDITRSRGFVIQG